LIVWFAGRSDFEDRPSRDERMKDRRMLAMITMTKADLVDHVAGAVDLPKKQADEVVQVVLDSVILALRSGEKVELRGFGSFRVRQRDARIGRNPKTGAKVQVPPKRIPYFKPGKHLREELLAK